MDAILLLLLAALYLLSQGLVRLLRRAERPR